MAFTACQERGEEKKKKKGGERIYIGWKVVHTTNSSTFTARSPDFSGRHVFLFFGLCAETTIYVPNTAMCNFGDLVSSLVFVQFKE